MESGENKELEELRERVKAGKATAGDLRDIKAEIIRNCPDKNSPLLKKSLELMLSVDNEPNDYPVTKYSGQKMLEILKKSIEQKELQEQGKVKEKSESQAR